MANLPFVLEKLRTNNPKSVITQGYLRSDVLLTASNANITFPFLLAQLQTTVKCMPIQPGDAFCICAWALKIYKSADTGAATAGNISQTVDYSYPNPNVFTKSGEASNLESLFNGYLKIIMNNNVINSQYPAYKFRRVNTSQKGSQTGVAAGPIYSTVSSEEQNFVSNGLVALEPTINFLGNWNFQAQLIPPAALDLTGTASTNYVSLILDGFLIQQGALSQDSFKGL